MFNDYCAYGCGNEGIYHLKNGKLCCQPHYNKCPNLKKKNSEAQKKRPQESYKIAAKKISLTIKKLYIEGKLTGRAATDLKEKIRREKISSTMKKNPNSGGYRIGSGRCNGEWYTSPIAGKVYMDSSYEILYAKHLDKNEIKWTKNKKKFPYMWKNRTRNYIPDFYLFDTNEYIETKGYKTEKDLAKWNNFPHKLTILFKKDLDILGENPAG